MNRIRTTHLACSLVATVAAGCGSGGGASGGPDADGLTAIADHDASAIALEVDLDARASIVDFGAVAPTDVWTYSGALPGPLIDAKVGDHLKVKFHNGLAEATTIYWHGVRVPNSMDGVPSVTDPVPAGGDFVYEFDLKDAGLFWYHPHVRSDAQVERGLYGVIRVRGADEPAFDAEHIFVLDDVLLDANGALAPDGTAPNESMIGRQGNTMLVNGRSDRVVTLHTGERQRWRLLNAAVARYFRLSLPGHRFTVIGSDVGLVDAPQTVDELLLVPGERADVVVEATGAPGSEATLVSLPYDRGHDTGGGGPLAVLRVVYAAKRSTTTPHAIPATLRAIADAAPDVVRTRQLALSEQVAGGAGGHAGHTGHGGATTGATGDPTFQINGTAFPNVPLLQATLGETELWEFQGAPEMDHPMHLHGFSFQVVSVNGTAPGYRAWKDTVNVPRGQTVRVAVKLDGFPGKWMYHCHILAHAERGMMGELDVAP